MKRLNLLSIALLLAAMSFLLTTCGDDKKEKSSSSSSVESALVGYWFGSSVNTSEGLWMVLNLKSNGYADYRLFRSDVNDYHDISNFTSLPWRYNSSKNHIFLYISDTEGYSFPILSYSGNYMTVTRTLSGNVIQFNLERSSGSSSGGSSGGGSGGGSSSGKQCTYCQGNGKCNFYTSYTGNKYYCHGSGKCQFCGGDGYTDGFGINNVLCSNCYGYKGSGKCSYCSGTGICSKCGGTGYR